MPDILKGYVDTSLGQVHYRTSGPGLWKVPLVLFHQTASSSVMYEALMRELGAEVWTFAPDTPGFGGTFQIPGKPSIRYYSEILYESIRAMGIKQCWMFGHHTGASIAVQMTNDHPEMTLKLILCGPPYLSAMERRAWISGTAPTLIDRDGDHLKKIWSRICTRDSSAPVDLLHREAVLNLHACERYHEAYIAAFEHNFADQLSAIDCPILMLAGEFDTLIGSLQRAGNAANNGVVRVIPNGTTYVCDRGAKSIATMLKEFLLI